MCRDGKLIVSVTKRMKTQVLRVAQVELWDRAYLQVIYNPKSRLMNDGYYSNYKDLKQALSIFTGKRLINYAKGVDDEKND